MLKNTRPKKDGFIMPGEYELHDGCWMIWPERTDVWRLGAKPAQKSFAEVANAISKYEPVTILTSKAQYENAIFHLEKNIRVIEMSTDDSWMRDIGPTFIKNLQTGEVRGVDWIFNSWGGLNEGLYFPWYLDDQVAHKTCNILKYDYYRAPLILEGGSIHSDGEGTIYTTEECLLNPNRNPNLTKNEIENYLKDYLGADKIIWLPFGVYNDETNGHVDNLLHVVNPGHIVLTWTDDKKDPQYKRSKQALDVLLTTKDAKGRTIKVTKIHQPNPIFVTIEEISTLDTNNKVNNKKEKDKRLPASYANFYIANNAIILPIFNDKKWDTNAVKVLKSIFPNYMIETIYSKEILLGGGNIHCITQQQVAKK